MFELKVVAKDNYQIDYEAASGDQFIIQDNSLIWMDANDQPQIPNICQQYDPIKDLTWRGFDPLKHANMIERVNYNNIRVHYAPRSELYGEIQLGRTFQYRWHIRNQCGVVINECQDVTFDSVNVISWNGLGFVCQLSNNLTMRNLRMEPNPASGRTNAGFSDGIQIFACTGEILIENNRFVGMHDDHINIYGQMMRVDEISNNKTLDVVYPGEETEGHMNFHKGDSIQFRNPKTLAAIGIFKVEDAELVNSKTLRLRLDGVIPRNSEGFWVENLTWIPKRVTIRGNYFGRVPTRSILMYAAREAIIENNTFHRIPMETILMKCPDMSYGLQNHLEKLTVRNNVFYECIGTLINSEPEVSILATNANLYGTLEVKDNLVIMREIMPYFLDVRGFSRVVIGANRIELVNLHPLLANFNNCKEIYLTPQMILGVIEPPTVNLKNVIKHSGSGWKVEIRDSL